MKKIARYCVFIVLLAGFLVSAVFLWLKFFSATLPSPAVLPIFYWIGVGFLAALTTRLVSREVFWWLLLSISIVLGVVCLGGAFCVGMTAMIYPRQLPAFTIFFVGEGASQLVCYLWTGACILVIIGTFSLGRQLLNKITSARKEG